MGTHRRAGGQQLLDHHVALEGGAGLPAPQVATAPAEALRLARSLATPRGLVCVAGSFFLAAEIRAVMERPLSPGR